MQLELQLSSSDFGYQFCSDRKLSEVEESFELLKRGKMEKYLYIWLKAL